MPSLRLISLRAHSVAGLTVVSLTGFAAAPLSDWRAAPAYGSDVSPRSVGTPCATSMASLGITDATTVRDDTGLQAALAVGDDTALCLAPLVDDTITLSRTILLDDTSLTLIGADDTDVVLEAPATGGRHIHADLVGGGNDTLTITKLALTGGDDTGGVDPSPGLTSGGGSIRVVGQANDLLRITDSLLHDNAAESGSSSQGGAVYVFGALVTIQATDFIDNRAVGGGGAIGAQFEPAIAVTGGTFSGNATYHDGGAINASSNVTVANASFIYNNAETGVGGAIRTTVTAQVTNSTFYGNRSGRQGAAVRSTSLVLRFVTSVDDTAARDEGVFSSVNPPTIRGSVISPLAGRACTGIAPTDTSFSFVTGSGCGTSPGITFTTRSALGFSGARVTDDSTGAQVLIPDDTSVLINAAPYNLVSGVTTDQLLATRGRAPDDSTTVGAVQVLPIAVTVQPADISVGPGANATFTAAGLPGVGTSVTYQWQTSSDGGATWGNRLGATSPTLTLTGVTTGQDGLRVRAQVSDIRNQPVPTNAATLTVTAPAPTPGPSPASPPGAPRDPVAVAGDAEAAVRWLAPSSSGSFSITNYEVANDVNSRACLLTVEPSAPLACTLTELTNGTAYRFRVRALNGAGWGPWSDWSAPVIPQRTPEPTPTIVITGAREGRFVRVNGTARDLTATQVTTHLRLSGQTGFATGVSRPVAADGTFTWQRRTAKQATVYFTGEEIRSNLVVIPAGR